MKHPTRMGILLAPLLLQAAWASTPPQAFVELEARQRYLGQTPPGVVPERFAPGVVSTEAIEINGVFAPDFGEFFFARQIDGVFTLFHAVREGERWSAPQPLHLYPDGGAGVAVDMAFSPDGTELFFLGRFQPGVEPMKAPLDIWASRKENGAWQTAERVAAPVSTDAVESYPTMAADGSLYFSSDRAGGHGGYDIWRAQRLPDGGFAEPVNVGAPVNTEHGEGDTFVAPDESYLIFASGRPGAFGRGDLYVSFRDADGGWGEPVNLGDAINSETHEFCPMVTPDGRYLFFSRSHGGPGWDKTTDADVFWVDASVIERLRDADAQRAALAEQVRREIMPLFEAMEAAAQALDADAHVAFWARQPEPMLVASFLGSEVKLVGWDTILEKQREWWAGAKPDPANPAYGLLEGPDVVVADAAHAMLYFVLEARGRDAEGVARKFRLMISQLWQKQDDGWKVIYTHESTGGEIAE